MAVLISARHISYYLKQPSGNTQSAIYPHTKDFGVGMYTVKRIIDGDTIVLSGNEKIRYIGVNTPEIRHPGKDVEYFGPEAAEFNKKLALNKSVRLEFDNEKYDRYHRILAYVFLEDGTFVNSELVKQGYARTMTIKPNTKYADLFKELQNQAKAKKLGLWGKL